MRWIGTRYTGLKKIQHGAGGLALGGYLGSPQRVRLVAVVKSECPSGEAIKRLDNEEKEKDKEANNQLK